jgi:hypothetical protein
VPAREALKRVAAGEPLGDIALSYNIDHSTISQAQGAPCCRDLTEPGVVFSGVNIFADRRRTPGVGMSCVFCR